MTLREIAFEDLYDLTKDSLYPYFKSDEECESPSLRVAEALVLWNKAPDNLTLGVVKKNMARGTASYEPVFIVGRGYLILEPGEETEAVFYVSNFLINSRRKLVVRSLKRSGVDRILIED